MMSPLGLFGISIAFSFIAWGIVLARYLWPELRRQSRADAMRGQSGWARPGSLGAAYFIVTVLVPLLLITHGLVFRLLRRRDSAEASHNNPA